jgi:hypothetical protein
VTAIDLDAWAWREIAVAMRAHQGKAWTGPKTEALTAKLEALATEAEVHDLAHPGDPCVWRLHGPDDEPSPILRIDTARGPVSLDVRCIDGAAGTMISTRISCVVSGQGLLLDFATDAEARAALDRVHAARVAHDDQHAEDRRTERLAEAVARGVSEELRAILPTLGQQLVGVVDRLAAQAMERALYANARESETSPALPRPALYSTRQAIASAGLTVTMSASEAVELLAAQRDENATRYLALLADFDRLRTLHTSQAADIAAKLEALAAEADREAEGQTDHGRMLYCEGQAHGMRHAARMLVPTPA